MVMKPRVMCELLTNQESFASQVRDSVAAGLIGKNVFFSSLDVGRAELAWSCLGDVHFNV